MAIDVFSLTGKIAVDYADAQKGLSGITTQAGKTASALGNVSESADDSSTAIDGAGSSAKSTDSIFSTWQITIANLISNAITGLIDKCSELASQIIEIGSSTETAFAKLETIAGSENIDDLTASLSELAKQTGTSSADLAEVAYNAISAGVSVEEACEMAETATMLATAGFTDADSALSVLTTALNSYGDTAGTATEISDSLVMVQNLGVTTISELSNSIGKAIATGSAYSVSLGNLESAYVSITKAGIGTAEATTYMNSMLNELGDSGSDVSSVLQEQTGKSFTELMNDGYSLADVLSVLYDSCEGDSTALMNLWSSAEAGKASNAIVNQGLSEFNENLSAITSTAGVTEEAYATMSDTFDYQLSVMKTNFQELGIAIFDGLEDPLTSGIDFVLENVIPNLSTLADNFVEFLPTLQEFGEYVLDELQEPLSDVTALIVDTILPTFTDFATNTMEDLKEPLHDVGEFISSTVIPAIKTLVENFDVLAPGITAVASAFVVVKTAMGIQALIQGVSGAFTALNVAMNANPAIAIATAIIALITALWTLYNTNEDFREQVDEIFGAVKETMVSVFETVTQALSDAWEWIKETFTNIYDTISETFNNVVETISSAWDTICGAVQFALDLISSLFNTWITLITLPWQFLWANFHEPITKAFTLIKNIVTTYLNAVKTVWTTIFNACKTITTTVFNAIKTAITTVMNGIKKVITTYLNICKTTWTAIFNAVKTVVTTVFNTIKTTISTVLSGIKNTVTTIFTNIYDSIYSKITAVKTFISNAIDFIQEKFNFTWSLPDIKLPHFTISPTGWKISDLLQGDIPTLSVDWYAKAMEKGMIMTQPTVFGYNADTNSLLAGGESGSETVVGTDSLLSMIQSAVQAQNNETATQIVNLIGVMQQYLPIIAEKTGTGSVYLDSSTLVGSIATKMNTELGNITRRSKSV